MKIEILRHNFKNVTSECFSTQNANLVSASRQKKTQKIKVHDRDAINLQYRELFTGRDHGRRHREGEG